jgi:hypothetical protein
MDMATAEAPATGLAAITTRVGTADQVAGMAGLVFVAIAVAQNLLRGSGPLNDASATDVATYYGAHRSTVAALVALFAVGAVALFTFVSGLYARLRSPESGELGGWARVGFIAVIVVGGTFTAVNVLEIGVATTAGQATSDTALVGALWHLYWAGFALNLVPLSLALAGLGTAAAVCGVVPRWVRPVVSTGALLLLAGGAGAVAIADGSHWLAVGVPGYVIWLGFVAITGVSLLRRTQGDPPAGR